LHTAPSLIVFIVYIVVNKFLFYSHQKAAMMKCIKNVFLFGPGTKISGSLSLYIK